MDMASCCGHLPFQTAVRKQRAAAGTHPNRVDVEAIHAPAGLLEARRVRLEIAHSETIWPVKLQGAPYSCCEMGQFRFTTGRRTSE